MKKVLVVLIIILSIFSGLALATSKFNSQWQQSISHKQKLLKEEDVDKLKLNYELAVAYANVGQIKKATKIFKNLDEDEGRKKLKSFITSYQQRLQDHPTDIKTINYLAFAYYIDEQYKKSKKSFKRIIKLDPNNIWSYNYLAVTQHELEKYDQAEESLKKSLKIEDNEYTHFLLGVNYYKKGYMVQALYHVGRGSEAADLFLD